MSTSVNNKATMLVSVSCIFQEDVHEDVLCALLCHPIPQLQNYSMYSTPGEGEESKQNPPHGLVLLEKHISLSIYVCVCVWTMRN